MSTAPRLEAAKRDWGHDETGCTVLHIDMDAFYASLEVARHPELAGKPVIIGTGPRSVVSAASYEARRYGVNSAMPSARARQLCPDGIFLPVDMRYYRMQSRRIFTEVFEQITDRIEQVSVDEGYMDVSAALTQWDHPSHIGAWIRQEVARRFHVTCSVGIAGNKLVAKMASTNAKPNGMLLIPLAKHAEFVQMMPLRGIPGIGPSLERKLNDWGVTSVADLARMDEISLTRATGSALMAHGLWQAARGIDDRAVTPYTPEKSVGAERTMQQDTRSWRTVSNLLRWACDDVASTLRRRGLMARTITVKLRFADLSYQTRSHTLEQPVNTASTMLPEALALLTAMLGMGRMPAPNDDQARLPKLIRLAGINMSGLSEVGDTVIQPSLADLMDEDIAAAQRSQGTAAGTTKPQRLTKAEQALDAVRQRFGSDAASLGL